MKLTARTYRPQDNRVRVPEVESVEEVAVLVSRRYATVNWSLDKLVVYRVELSTY